MKNTLKLEEVGILSMAVFGLYLQPLEYSWWMWIILFLLPDIGMIGYLVNAGVGAFTYNLLHHRLLGAVLLGYGYYMLKPSWCVAGLIILAHASFDRILGFGLKYPDHFKNTHMGWIGGERNQ